nr:uncharacterized protein LOC129387676 [Dermacentor andersoni]
MKSGRVRVRRILSSSDSEESDKDVAMQTQKNKNKKREGPSNKFLEILAAKKKKLTEKDCTEQQTQLSAAQEEVARLSSTVKEQEELKELRALNRELQRKLLDSFDCKQGTTASIASSTGTTAQKTAARESTGT